MNIPEQLRYDVETFPLVRRALLDAELPSGNGIAEMGRRIVFGPDPETPLARFKRSMIIDHEKWHDGVGYDLEALRSASGAERAAIETLVLRRGVRDWRDLAALAALNTPRASAALESAINSNDHEVRAAIIEHAPALVFDPDRAASMIDALAGA